MSYMQIERKVFILWYWWPLFEHTSFVLKPRDYDHVIILVFRLMLSSYTDSTQINIIIIQICTILQQWFGWQQLRINLMDSVVFFPRVYTWWFNDWIPWHKYTNIFKVGLAGPKIAKKLRLKLQQIILQMEMLMYMYFPYPHDKGQSMSFRKK